MTDIVIRLRRDGGNLPTSNDQRQLDEVAARTIETLRGNATELLEQRRRVVEAVRSIHANYDGYCMTCDGNPIWPCATAQACGSAGPSDE